MPGFRTHWSATGTDGYPYALTLDAHGVRYDRGARTPADEVPGYGASYQDVLEHKWDELIKEEFGEAVLTEFLASVRQASSDLAMENARGDRAARLARLRALSKDCALPDVDVSAVFDSARAPPPGEPWSKRSDTCVLEGKGDELTLRGPSGEARTLRMPCAAGSVCVLKGYFFVSRADECVRIDAEGVCVNPIAELEQQPGFFRVYAVGLVGEVVLIGITDSENDLRGVLQYRLGKGITGWQTGGP